MKIKFGGFALYLFFLLVLLQSCTPDNNSLSLDTNPGTCPYPVRAGSTISYSVVANGSRSTENWTFEGDTTIQGQILRLADGVRTGTGVVQTSRFATGKNGANYYTDLKNSILSSSNGNTTLTNSNGLLFNFAKTDQPVGHTWSHLMNLTAESSSVTGTQTVTSINSVSVTYALTVTEVNTTVIVEGVIYNNVTKIFANSVQNGLVSTYTNGVLSAQNNIISNQTNEYWVDCSRGVVKTSNVSRTYINGRDNGILSTTYSLIGYNF